MMMDRIAPRISLCLFLLAWMGLTTTVGAQSPFDDSAEYGSARPNEGAAKLRQLAESDTYATAYDPTRQMTELEARLDYELQRLRHDFDTLKAGSAKPKYPSLEVHGVFQVDSAWFDQSANNIATINDLDGPGNGDIQDGASFRRARLSANGAVAENMNYFLQMDFAFFGRPTFTDVWMEFTKVPVLGNVKVGQWKQPFSLEVVSSFRYTTFAERSLLFQAFDPFRHIGIGFWNYSEDERMTWAASLYRPGQDQFGGSLSDNGGYAGVGRVTMLPWWECEGAEYLHVGAGYNYVAPKDETARFRTIPEYFVGEQAGVTPAGTSGQAAPGNFNGTPFFVDTGAKGVRDYNLFGAEVLWVDGPLSVQSEAMWLYGTRTNGLSMYFPGAYAQVGYFLTGEHRPYNRKQGAIDRIQVKRPFGILHNDECEYGWGAWELAARYSYINLNSKDITGGQLSDMTLGLNWYINNYAKIQLNYIRAFLDNKTHGSSTANIVGLRAQLDF